MLRDGPTTIPTRADSEFNVELDILPLRGLHRSLVQSRLDTRPQRGNERSNELICTPLVADTLMH